MDLKSWLPTIIAAGALVSVWILIRRMVADLKADLVEKLKTMQREINYIKETYIDAEKHALICGKSSLEIEKLFKECLNEVKDAIFNKIREFEKKLNEK
jgi:sugar-specific transcriptional regulator TrmB